MLKLCKVAIGSATYWMSLLEATSEAASSLFVETEGAPPEETPKVVEMSVVDGSIMIRVEEDDGTETKRSVWAIHLEQTEPTIISCSEW
jgi:hypothetical protein